MVHCLRQILILSHFLPSLLPTLFFKMKSAYELAMERLADEEPQVKLTDEQRAELAAIDEKFTAKIAEKEVFLSGLIAKATSTGNFEELAQLETQKSREISRLNSQREEEKEKVRKAAAS